MLLLLVIELAGQCKYERNETDAFEGVKSIQTSPVKVMYPTLSGISTWFSLIRFGDSSYVTTKLALLDPVCLNGQSELLLKLENESVVRLPHNSMWMCSGEHHVFTFRLPDEFKEILTSSPLAQIRIYTTTGPIDIDITKGNSAKKAGAEYFIKNLPCLD